MGLEFDGSTQYAQNTGAVIASPTMAFACWFWPDTTHTGFLFQVAGDTSGDYPKGDHSMLIQSAGTASTRSLIENSAVSFSVSSASSGNSYTTGAWNHVIATWNGTINKRRVALNNGTTVSSGGFTPINPPLQWTYAATRIASGDFFDGRIAELAVWEGIDLLNLSDADKVKASLYAGMDPLQAYPSSLTHLFRFVNGELVDIVGKFSLSTTGSPTATSHPPLVIRPKGRLIVPPQVVTTRRVLIGGKLMTVAA